MKAIVKPKISQTFRNIYILYKYRYLIFIHEIWIFKLIVKRIAHV